jgi:hypothetical protein
LWFYLNFCGKLKLSHNLLPSRLFQFTRNLSLGGGWPELREGWLHKLAMYNQTDFLTECKHFKASNKFFLAFLPCYFFCDDSVL